MLTFHFVKFCGKDKGIGYCSPELNKCFKGGIYIFSFIENYYCRNVFFVFPQLPGDIQMKCLRCKAPKLRIRVKLNNSNKHYNSCSISVPASYWGLVFKHFALDTSCLIKRLFRFPAWTAFTQAGIPPKAELKKCEAYFFKEAKAALLRQRSHAAWA